MKIITKWLCGALCAALLWCAAPLCARGGAVPPAQTGATLLEVDVLLDSWGQVNITETWHINAGQNRAWGAVRTQDIRDIRMFAEDGTGYQFRSNVADGDPLVNPGYYTQDGKGNTTAIWWTVRPDGKPHTYTLHYRLAGAVRKYRGAYAVGALPLAGPLSALEDAFGSGAAHIGQPQSIAVRVQPPNSAFSPLPDGTPPAWLVGGAAAPAIEGDTLVLNTPGPGAQGEMRLVLLPPGESFIHLGTQKEHWATALQNQLAGTPHEAYVASLVKPSAGQTAARVAGIALLVAVLGVGCTFCAGGICCGATAM